MVDQLEEALDPASADLMLPSLERAVGSMIRTILRSDDSSGIQGDATCRLLDLHVDAARLGSPDPVKLARWMAKVGFGDDGFFAVDPVAYADALGERGLAAYRREVDRRLDVDPTSFYPRLALERLAVLSRDVPLIVELVGGPLDSAYRYRSLVEALLEIGEKDRALQYAEDGRTLAVSPHTRWLVEAAVELHLGRGEIDLAVALQREYLARQPTESSYAALRRTAEPTGRWSDERLGALDVLLERNPSAWLTMLLDEGEGDLAWEAAQTMSVGPALRHSLLRSRARTHPGEVLEGYVELIDTTLQDTAHYREAVKFLGELRRACVTGGRVPDYAAYVDLLLERHRRRPTLVRMLSGMPQP